MPTIKRKRPPPPTRRRPEKVLPPPPIHPAILETVRRRRWVFRDEMLSEYVGGVCYVTVWRWMKADKFPLPYLVGDTNAWDEAELLAWQQSCPRRGYHKSEVA